MDEPPATASMELTAVAVNNPETVSALEVSVAAPRIAAVCATLCANTLSSDDDEMSARPPDVRTVLEARATTAATALA